MLFIISKLCNFLLYPINWIFFFLILGGFFRGRSARGKGAAWYITAFVCFLIFTNTQLATLALDIWSRQYNRPLPAGQVYDIAIVAGGGVEYSPAWHQIDYNWAGDRLVEAIRLYRLGVVRKLYLSGDEAFNDFDGVNYAPEFLRYMEQMGVSSSDIVLEQEAQTTAENVRYLRKLLPEGESPILVITSGWHMRRVMKGFAGSGFNLVPYAVDVPSIRPHQQWQEYLPTWRASLMWGQLFHEMAGLLII